MTDKEVWEKLIPILGIKVPAAPAKQQIVVNNRHNRTIRLNMIKLVVKSFARLNADSMSQTNCGLIKAKVNGKNYYYGVNCDCNNKLVAVPITAFPTGITEGLLEMYWLQTRQDAVGVIIHHNKVLPLIPSASGLTIGSWKE